MPKAELMIVEDETINALEIRNVIAQIMKFYRWYSGEEAIQEALTLNQINYNGYYFEGEIDVGTQPKIKEFLISRYYITALETVDLTD